jgi:hypothetical protein
MEGLGRIIACLALEQRTYGAELSSQPGVARIESIHWQISSLLALLSDLMPILNRQERDLEAPGWMRIQHGVLSLFSVTFVRTRTCAMGTTPDQREPESNLCIRCTSQI